MTSSESSSPEISGSVGPIVLIGPMGVGKTTIGKKLARSLGIPFIDTDAQIVEEFGPIPAIFEESGEPRFRDIEAKALKRAVAQRAVVATGGGVVLLPENRDLLTSHTVVYLSTDGRHMANRLVQGKRPLLKNGMQDWRRIYEERKPLYESVATFEIDAGSNSLAQCIEQIRGKLGID